MFWFRKLAAKGNSLAQDGLGLCYYTGRGVAQDYTQAVAWWHKAMEGSKFVRQQTAFRLAECYEKGLGVGKDCARAVEYYCKVGRCAYPGDEPYHSESQYRLGLCYYNGTGVKQDCAQAVQWWRKAVKNEEYPKTTYRMRHHPQAEFYLGLCYEMGQGVEKSLYRARDWYMHIANEGHAQAAFRLAALYETYKIGRGNTKDLASAAKYYRKAAEMGVDGAQEALDRVEKKIRWGPLALFR